MSSGSDVPHVPLVERSILSMMIRDDAFRRNALGEGLKAEQFYSLRPVFEAVIALARAGTPVDAATLSAYLDQKNQLLGISSGPVTGLAAIEDIARYEPNGANFQHWLADLRTAHAKRVARDGSRWMESATDAAEALEAAKETVSAISQALAPPSRSLTARQAARRFSEWLKTTRSLGAVPGIRTGMDDLDQITGGLRPGQLWVVLAQTSRGKSVLMQQFGVEAVTAGKRTAFFSIEMQAEEVMARIVSRWGKFDFGKLMKPHTLQQRDVDILGTHLTALQERPFTIDATPGMTLAHIEAESTRLRDEYGEMGLVVVDYLQIIEAIRKKGGNREEDVAGLSGGLKQLAKALNCPVVTGAQLNRNNLVRESDKIGHDADVLLMIGDDGIRVAKNRNGKRDDVLPYELIGEFQSFVPFIPEEREEERRVQELKADQEARRKGGRR